MVICSMAGVRLICAGYSAHDMPPQPDDSTTRASADLGPDGTSMGMGRGTGTSL
jgi:hypothetical protein